MNVVNMMMDGLLVADSCGMSDSCLSGAQQADVDFESAVLTFDEAMKDASQEFVITPKSRAHCSSKGHASIETVTRKDALARKSVLSNVVGDSTAPAGLADCDELIAALEVDSQNAANTVSHFDSSIKSNQGSGSDIKTLPFDVPKPPPATEMKESSTPVVKPLVDEGHVSEVKVTEPQGSVPAVEQGSVPAGESAQVVVPEVGMSMEADSEEIVPNLGGDRAITADLEDLLDALEESAKGVERTSISDERDMSDRFSEKRPEQSKQEHKISVSRPEKDELADSALVRKEPERREKGGLRRQSDDRQVVAVETVKAAESRSAVVESVTMTVPNNTATVPVSTGEEPIPAETAKILVNVANEVADAMMVERGQKPGEGSVFISLKTDVLSGTEVKVVSRGGVITVEFMPTTNEVSELLVRNQAQLVQHLTERVHGMKIAVSVKGRSGGRDNDMV